MPRSTGRRDPARSRPWSRCMAAAALRTVPVRSCRAIRTGASGSSRPASSCLFPDSYGSRGLRSQCRVRERERSGCGANGSPTPMRRAAGCRARAGSPPTASRCSAGRAGRTPRCGPCARGPQARDGKPDFRSAVAFYPGCRRLRDQAWSARIPTLILIGTADDWTPASVCEQMVAGARGRSAAATIVTYRGAHHDFDRPDLVAACAHRARLHARRLRARACRNRSGRARGCAQARAGVAHAVMSGDRCTVSFGARRATTCTGERR